MKIGIDFGSTYSVISKYNSSTDNVESLALAQGAPACIPSVVSLSRKGDFTCGTTAKEQMGRRTVRIFEAFKMLLTEGNKEVLQRRGYDDEYTPRRIAREFLQSVIDGVMLREGAESVQNIVVCMPEIWNYKCDTEDGRAILRDILREEIDVNNPNVEVRVVTEPEAASAFIAYNYEKETRQNFNGHLLLIDYGGGTLDLTLTQVSSMGNGSMEISYREGGGAGENHRDEEGGVTIGRAGIAYMQGVVQRALLDAELVDSENDIDYTAPAFVAAVKGLESQLKDPCRFKDIEGAFGTYGAYTNIEEILEEDSEDFCELEYEDELLVITYQQMFQAYRDIIEGVLKEELGKINKLVQKHIGNDPCTPDAGARDNFKIAMVGGFSNFYLVKKQIAEIYHLDANSAIDRRMKNVSADKQEQAISLGAALLAAGKVELKKTARRSIGIYARGSDGKMQLSYGIKYHQTVETGKPYFLCWDESMGGSRMVFSSLYGHIQTFAIENSDRLNCGKLMYLKPKMQERLQKLPKDGFWYLGFSLDESDVTYFHVVPEEGDGNGQTRGLVIPLDNYNEMFDMTIVKEVKV